MLYLDYSRDEGQWVPNIHGGNENLETTEFLKRLNANLYRRYPHAAVIAEESTAWPGVSRPVDQGGLGFGYKWNMGWMNDTLAYMGRDPIHRQFHHREITFGFDYAFDENFILPLSHDEVVHGKGSLLGRMPGDPWQRFANLRAYYGFMWGHPGKKLLFMGCEFGQASEWDHESELPWDEAAQEPNRQVSALVRELNALHCSEPALHQQDCQPGGLQWIEGGDAENSVVAFIRWDRAGAAPVAVITNFTPTVQDYRVGMPRAGTWTCILNTDSRAYGGSGVSEAAGSMTTEASAWHGQEHSLALKLPPLATLYLRLES
jgi:1,4-alpha-glucan branching enzyme